MLINVDCPFDRVWFGLFFFCISQHKCNHMVIGTGRVLLTTFLTIAFPSLFACLCYFDKL